jgi:hypothetical protein
MILCGTSLLAACHLPGIILGDLSGHAMGKVTKPAVRTLF